MKKRYILGIVILSLIGLGMYAYAGTLMDSSEVSFDNTDIDTDAETVQDALEELYDRLSETHIIIDLGTNTSFDVKYECEKNGIDYTKLTANNFVISSVSGKHYGAGSSMNYGDWGNAVQTDLTFTKSYNATTGVLSCKIDGHSWNYDSNGTRNHAYGTASVHVYLITGQF